MSILSTSVMKHSMVRGVLIRISLLGVLIWAGAVPVPLAGAQSHADLVVDARCSSEVRTTAPNRVTLGITVISSAAQPQFNGTLIIDDASTAQPGILSVPKSGWVSFIFPGPVFDAQYYCAEAQSFRDMFLSYIPKPNFRLALSPSGDPTSGELGHHGGKADTALAVRAVDGDPTRFRSGGGTSTPYWLQYSISLSGANNVETTLYGRF